MPVNPPREGKGALAVGFWWYVVPSLSLCGFGADGVAVVALIGQQDVTFTKAADQQFGLGAIGDLVAGQAEGNRAAFGVDERVDLAREPAAGAPYAAIPAILQIAGAFVCSAHAAIVSIPFFPVAACWWTRTQVESIMMILPS